MFLIFFPLRVRYFVFLVQNARLVLVKSNSKAKPPWSLELSGAEHQLTHAYHASMSYVCYQCVIHDNVIHDNVKVDTYYYI